VAHLGDLVDTTVSSTGLVTAVTAGTANITVTTDDGGFTATCMITVDYAKGDVSGNMVKTVNKILRSM